MIDSAVVSIYLEHMIGLELTDSGGEPRPTCEIEFASGGGMRIIAILDENQTEQLFNELSDLMQTRKRE